jgi:hypothetical protein
MVGDAARRITTWIAHGGTQAENGAFCGWRDLRTDGLSAPYPEITGYVLGFLARAEPGGEGRQRAEAAARWLAGRTEAGDYSARPEKTGCAVYTFDVAMAGHGLYRYGRAARDERYVAAGMRLATYLIAQAERYGGLPCVIPETTDGPLLSTWSTAGGLHLAKVVQVLLDADEHGVPGAADAARGVVDTVLDQEEPFLTCPASSVISLHALCYAAEGLWMWARARDDRQALETSHRITTWVSVRQLPGHGYPGFVDLSGRPAGERQTDVLAQVIRLAALHGLTGLDVDAAVAELTGSTWRDGDREAVIYWPESPHRHLNCWASLFAAQALHLQGDTRAGLDWWELV